ncbi:MAG: hypothetical protein GC193_15350 [Cryomorphaceae bacterium]|nr:hypothetical protein [Cryomorphaceae bacterium]
MGLFKEKKTIYAVKSILLIGLAALVIVVTVKYGLKTSPIIRVLSLIVNALVIYLAYKTLKKGPYGN